MICPIWRASWWLAFLGQAIGSGFFHADMHQGNLFIEPDGTIAAVDFGIMGRIDRRARVWLGEIIYGLTTGDYARVAEIHFEAQYVPAYHSVAEFATALRAVGERIRGRPVSELSVGQMLDGLFAITREFDMAVQPHLLLLQKTMVMVEGLAKSLDPDINMWEISGPFVRAWMRDELGPEAALADGLRAAARRLLNLPALLDRVEQRFSAQGRRARCAAAAACSADVGATPPARRPGWEDRRAVAWRGGNVGGGSWRLAWVMRPFRSCRTRFSSHRPAWPAPEGVLFRGRGAWCGSHCACGKMDAEPSSA